MSGFFGEDHISGPPALDGRAAYNSLNPRAMRGNYTQMVLELVLFHRLLRDLELDPALCPGVDASAAPDGRLRLDPEMEVVMGQSLGALLTGIVAAVDPDEFQGAILSGAGASWIESVFGVDDPIDLQALVELLPGLPDGETIDVWHPLLTAAELAMGSADNANFLPRVLQEPGPGRTAPHVLVIEGWDDEQVPTNMQRVVVAGLGLDLVGPDVGPDPEGRLLPRIEVAGGRQLDPPVSGNRVVAGQGPRTAAVVHYLEDGILHGHDVAFQLEAPKHQCGCFLEDLAAGKVPTIVEGIAQGAPCAP